ncbi:MAG: sodium-dependent transporter [Clostridiales bacterium]|nr:sodium-dependent transporter [Clostridiales bacterium]
MENQGEKTLAPGAKRERLGSRLGFILLSAGCAIGVGNVWKFPYLAGQNGGGLFVLFYFIFLIIMGIPVMTMEFSLGRASQKSPTAMYKALEKPGHKWHLHGYLALAGNYILLMFYTCVAGWILLYFFYFLIGKFDGVTDPTVIAGTFSEMLANPWLMFGFTAINIAIAVVVCMLKMEKGLERVTKIMMIALLALIIILIVNSFTLSGVGKGLEYYLVPNWDRVAKSGGFFSIIINAMNQAFFTLSLGIGSMAIFGSFINKDRALLGESVNIAILDTFVAISSGLIIFPAIFTFNIDPTAGPPLLFITLPQVFAHMPGGRIWGILFFLFMSFAALSTVLAVFQNIVSCTQDLNKTTQKIKKWKISLVSGIILLVLSIPCILGFNVWAFTSPIGDIQGIEDYIVSNILLPVGSFIFVLFCNHKIGWGSDNFLLEANTGKGLKVKKWMIFYFKWILPVILGIFIVISIINPFVKLV